MTEESFGSSLNEEEYSYLILLHKDFAFIKWNGWKSSIPPVAVLAFLVHVKNKYENDGDNFQITNNLYVLGKIS